MWSTPVHKHLDYCRRETATPPPQPSTVGLTRVSPDESRVPLMTEPAAPSPSGRPVSKVFVVGGTGAQGMPVVEGLVGDGGYTVRALTRDHGSARARQLADLGDVEILEGSLADEDVLRAGFRGCDRAFVNIDGFNTGEKTETYWAMRTYEIAVE